jgi:hypothetical protein
MSPEAREHSFDELTRGLASGSLSRGKALRLMGAALVGGTLASLGIGGVAAADDECKPLEKKCRKNQQCCSGNCVDRKCAACPSGTSACGTQCCPSGETCLHGIACCPNAKVCGTGAFAICCKGEAQSCVEGLCQCNDPGTLPCADQCVGCEGGTVNSETCLCECPSGTTLIGSTCCPNARVCGTGTSVTCCPEGQECGDGACCISNGFSNTCTADTQCCSKICDFLRGRFFCSHCRSIGGICVAGQCCNGICENGRCCWATGGHTCTDDIECCGGQTCRGGQCSL